MNQQGPETRIGDSDREAAVSALGEHYADGRLTKEEYDERADLAWSARTASALYPLFADLPRPEAPRPTNVGRDQSRAVGRRPHPRWRLGAVIWPILIVLGVLTVFAHLPLILLAVLVWFLLARSGRFWGHHHRRRHPRNDWVR